MWDEPSLLSREGETVNIQIYSFRLFIMSGKFWAGVEVSGERDALKEKAGPLSLPEL